MNMAPAHVFLFTMRGLTSALRRHACCRERSMTCLHYPRCDPKLWGESIDPLFCQQHGPASQGATGSLSASVSACTMVLARADPGALGSVARGV